MIERGKKTEPHGYMLKPANPVELRTTVEIALYKHQLAKARAEKAESERLLQAALLEMSRAVHESNEKFRMMVEAVKDYAIVMLETNGRIASWNVGAERLEGYCKQEIMGQHFSRFYTAGDIAAYDSSGQLRGFAKVTRDVTARKNAERQLYETSSLLRTVLDSVSETAIIATDPSLTVKVFNMGAEGLLGYASDEIVGRATPLLLHDPEEIRVCGGEISAQIGRPIEGWQIFQVPSMQGRSREWNYVRKDGSHVVVDLVVTPMQKTPPMRRSSRAWPPRGTSRSFGPPRAKPRVFDVYTDDDGRRRSSRAKRAHRLIHGVHPFERSDTVRATAQTRAS
jgi:PAS domain S-box-containing protein